jgi:hypothetical protein
MQAAATTQMTLATVATIRRAAYRQYRGINRAKQEPTVWHVENNSSTNDKTNDLNGIADRLEFRSHGGRETHILDDDRGKGVDHAIGNCSVDHVRSWGFDPWLLGLKTYAANTETNRSRVLGSKKPSFTCVLSNDLFLIPVSLPATRLTATMRSR